MKIIFLWTQKLKIDLFVEIKNIVNPFIKNSSLILIGYT